MSHSSKYQAALGLFTVCRARILSAARLTLRARGTKKIALLAFIGLFFTSLAHAQMNIEVRGKGVSIKDVGTSGQRHIYPLPTRTGWELSRFGQRGKYHFFEDRSSRISDLSYATNPIPTDYFDAVFDSRRDYSLDAFRADTTGEVTIAVPTSSLNAEGWRRVSGAFQTSIRTYYTYSYNYTRVGQWVNIPKTSSATPTLLFGEKRRIKWENPLPISTLAEGVIIAPGAFRTSHPRDPGILVMPNGDYIAYGRGPKRLPGRFIRSFKSTDKGKTWAPLNRNDIQVNHFTMFLHRGDLYVLGDLSSGKGGIQRSTDDGETWSSVVTLPFDFRTAPSHVVVAKGRLWCATESANVISAPTGADLMNPRSWKKARNTGDDVGGNEADLVATRNGGYPVIMPKGRYTTHVVNEDTVVTDRSRHQLSLPGNNGKYSAIYDPISDKYWALTHHSTIPRNIRTGTTLFSSNDLKTWKSEREVLKGISTAFHGFNYPYMAIDGDDIIFTSRTSWEDENGLAQRWHDANLLTFHRVRNFRGTSSTPVPTPTPTLTPSPTPTVAPPPPTGGTKRLIVRDSGHCVDIQARSRDNDANAQQWGCHSGDNQQIEAIEVGDGFVELKLKHSGKCLNIAGNSTDDSANVIQWNCRDSRDRGYANSQFKMESKSDGWFALVARHSNKCLDIAGASNDEGANVQQYRCHNGTNQQFKFE